MKNKLVKLIKSIDWANIPPATYVRYILMLVSIINIVLTRLGINPIQVSETELYQTVSDILTVVILIVNTWCNNSVTPEAINADVTMRDLKKENRE